MKQLSIVLLIFAIMITVRFNGGCERKDEARRVLKNANYHPITVGGYGWMKCGEDDVFATNFKAYNSDSSKIVTGCVCSGLFKGHTIRLD